MLASALNRHFRSLLWGTLLVLHGGASLAAGAAGGAAESETTDRQAQGVLAQRFHWQSPLDLSQGYLAGKSWAQSLRVVGSSQGLNLTPSSLAAAHSNPGLKLPSSAYLGLGYGTPLSAKGLDFYADVGLSLGTSWGTTVGGTLGLSAMTTPLGTSAYELSPHRGLRDTLGGMTLMPSASIGLVYRY
jgi:hypothetical protein